MIILNLLNRIFGPRGSLSRDDISSYQKKKNQHDIEEKSLTDDFDSDALDGWTESDITIEKMRDLDKKFQDKFNSNVWSSSTVLFFTFFFLASGIILFFTYTSNQNNEALITEVKSKKEEVSNINYESIENLPSEEDKAINKLETVSKEKEVQPSSLKRSNTVIKSEYRDTSKQEEVADYTPHISPEVQESIPVKENRSTLIYNKVDEFYLHDFKLIDYRIFRDAPIKKRKLVPAGTPADQEYYDDDKQEEFVWQDVDIPYIDYLDETMNYFEKSNYKKALKRFNVVIDTYKEDLNAHFYGGLCYYNLGQYEKAIDHFDNSYNLEFGNFRQEAQWFKAKALLELNRVESAKQLLHRISSEKKFYADEAQKLLQKIK